MNQEDADIVFGTDPDTDRLGVAIRHGEQYFLSKWKSNRKFDALLHSS